MDEGAIEHDGRSPRSGLPPPAEHRFKPGQSGNPRGRPKGASLTALIKEALARGEFTHLDADGKPAAVILPGGMTVADLVAGVIVRKALGGSFNFCKELLDRVDGRVPAKVEARGFVLADVVAEAEAAAAAYRRDERPKGK